MAKKIGRVKYVSKGAYNPAVTYKKLDIVLYGGSLWEPKQETTGNTPPDAQRNEEGTPAGNEYWQLFLPGALGDDYIKKTDIAKAPAETEPGSPGIVMPDGKTIQIDESGLLTGTPLDFTGTLKELQEGIASGEITNGMVGYIEGTGVEPGEPDLDHPNNILFEIDDFVSKYSSNAVQNRIIAGELELMKQMVDEVRALRATVESFGFSKICPVDVTDVTEDNGLVLGAVEKNASVEGTLAQKVSSIEDTVGKMTGNLKLCFQRASAVFTDGEATVTLNQPVISRCCIAQISGGSKYSFGIGACAAEGTTATLRLTNESSGKYTVILFYATNM